METIKFKDCLLHDCRIKFIEFNGGAIIFHILDTPYMDLVDVKMNIFLETDDSFNIAYIKQYPAFHKVKFKGKEISSRQLKSIFTKGCNLQIEEFYIAVDTNALIINFIVLPYSRKKRVYERIILTINYKFDYFNVLNN